MARYLNQQHLYTKELHGVLVEVGSWEHVSLHKHTMEILCVEIQDSRHWSECFFKVDAWAIKTSVRHLNYNNKSQLSGFTLQYL